MVKSNTTNPYVGKWEISCSIDEEKGDDDDDRGPEYKTEQLFIGHDQLSINMIMSDSSDCSSPFMRLTMLAKIEIGADSSTVKGARDIDITMSATLITPKIDSMTDQFNSEKLCGLSDWKTDLTRSVDFKICGFDEGDDEDAHDNSGEEAAHGPPEIGKSIYSIIKIVDGSLYIGSGDDKNGTNENDGSTAAKRVSMFDEKPYTLMN